MTQAFEISKITYRRKTHDKGIILGMRPWRWTLGAKYSPVFAKDAETGETLSVCAPQKTNFAVYVPAAHLEAGRTLLLVNHEYRQPRIETTIRILEVNPQWIDAEVLECKEAPRPETRAAKRRKVVDYAPKTCETCVNEDDFVFGGRPAENDAPVESEDEWTAASISASGYLEDADALNYDEYEMSELDVLMADVIDDAPQAAAPNEEKEIYEENAENDAERAEIRRKASSVERALRNSRDAAAARNFEVISRTRTAGMRIKTYQLQTIKHRGDCSRIRRDKYAPPEIGDKIMTREKTIQQLKKLHALAERGATEHERDAAQRMFEKLCAVNEITPEELFDVREVCFFTAKTTFEKRLVTQIVAAVLNSHDFTTWKKGRKRNQIGFELTKGEHAKADRLFRVYKKDLEKEMERTYLAFLRTNMIYATSVTRDADALTEEEIREIRRVIEMAGVMTASRVNAEIRA